MKAHSVEKIGGTSMSNYAAIRDNIIKKPSKESTLYQRIFVVSAYGGLTDTLLEHKKTSQPGIYALFANSLNDDSWHAQLKVVKADMFSINEDLFGEGALLDEANQFIGERLDDAEQCLVDLQRLCQHGHFELSAHPDSWRY